MSLLSFSSLVPCLGCALLSGSGAGILFSFPSPVEIVIVENISGMENVGVDQKVSCTGLAEDWGREAHSMGLAGFLTADRGCPSPPPPLLLLRREGCSRPRFVWVENRLESVLCETTTRWGDKPSGVERCYPRRLGITLGDTRASQTLTSTDPPPRASC